MYSRHLPNGCTTDLSCVALAKEDKRNRRRGMTMVEVMIAAVILVIALIGTSSSFVNGRRQLINQQFYRAAAQIASQKLEELKATGYELIPIGTTQDSVSFNGLTFTRQTVTQLISSPTTETPKPCKRVAVTISWSVVTDQHQARLVTYIGP